MLPEADVIRLRHMLEAARLAQNFVHGVTYDVFAANIGLQFQVIRAVEIIGEAASTIPPSTRATLPQLPWVPMTRMRNRLIHAYFNIDLTLVWETVSRDIPALIDMLNDILKNVDTSI